MNCPFSQALEKAWSNAEKYPGPKVARLIFLESPTVRRLVRSVASGRTAITDSAMLVAGLACMNPHFLEKELDEDTSLDYIDRARLRKTFGNTEVNRSRCMVHATRGMVVVEEAAKASGYSVEWITEGLDVEEIKRFLAIPDDHQFLGLLAIGTPDGQHPLILEFRPDVFMRDGFGGGWPKKR